MDLFACMKIFVATVKHGSLVAASRELNITPPMVSKSLSKLEEDLNIQLLIRTTRKQCLTDAGQIYYDHCDKIIQDIDAAKSMVSGYQSEPQGRMKISVPVSFGSSHMARQVSGFQNLFPKVNISVSCSDEKLDLISDGFDLAIRIAENLQCSSIRARSLAKCKMIFAASPSYIKEFGVPERLVDLKNHNCLIYSNHDKGCTWTAEGNYGTESVAVSGNSVVNNGDFATSLAVTGAGIILQPDFVIEKYLESGCLVPILEEYSVPDLTVFAVYPNKRYVSTNVREFINYMVIKFSQG